MGGLAYRGPVFTWSAQRHSHCWAAHWPQTDVQTQLVPPSSEGQSELPAEASPTGCKATDDDFSDPRACPKPSLQEEADPGDGIAEAAPPTVERPPQGAVWSWTAPHCPQHQPPCHPPSQTSGRRWACRHRLGPSDLSCSLEVPSGQVKPSQGGQHRASGLGSTGHPAPTPARGGVQHLQQSSPSWPSATRRRFKNSQESNSVNSGFIEKQQHWGPSRQPGPQQPPLPHCSHTHRKPETPPRPGPVACLRLSRGFWHTQGSQDSCRNRGLMDSKPQEVYPTTTTQSALCSPKDTASAAAVVQQPDPGDTVSSCVISAGLAECAPPASPPHTQGPRQRLIPGPPLPTDLSSALHGGWGALHSRSPGPWGRPGRRKHSTQLEPCRSAWGLALAHSCSSRRSPPCHHALTLACTHVQVHTGMRGHMCAHAHAAHIHMCAHVHGAHTHRHAHTDTPLLQNG